MAFNPFSIFQKNQKLWMVIIFFITMVSFIACGYRGDLGEMLIGMMGRRSGPVLVKVDGKSFYSPDLTEIRQRRDMANYYMQRCVNFALGNATEQLKQLSTKQIGKELSDKERQQQMGRFSVIQNALMERKLKKRYFDLGTKFDDLAEFAIWQAQADRLGIRLTKDHILQLFVNEMFGMIDRNQIFQAEQDTFREFHNRGMRQDVILTALGEEYRVQMAQLATLGAQPYSAIFRQNEVVDVKYTPPDVPDEIRMPVSPAQLFDFYKTKRSEFEVTLLPIKVADFAKKIAEPTQAELEDIFNRYKDKAYDPTSPESGLQIPQKAKIGFLLADPTSPQYRAAAKARFELSIHAITGYGPWENPLTAMSMLAARQIGSNLVLSEVYDAQPQFRYRTSEFSDPFFEMPMLAHLTGRRPEAAAAMIGLGLAPDFGFGTVAGYLSHGLLHSAEELKTGTNEVTKARFPVYATLFASTTTRDPWIPLTTFWAMDQKEAGVPIVNRMPLSIVTKEMQDLVERQTAEGMATQAIQMAKKELEKYKGRAKRANFERSLKALIPKYGLTHVTTKDAYDRYTMGTASELEPLRKEWEKYHTWINWIEGRDAGSANHLKAEDFPQMFFGATTFSTSDWYNATPWPPVVTPNRVKMQMANAMPLNISNEVMFDLRKATMDQDPTKQMKPYDLFEKSDRPVLFWHTEEFASEFPKSLDKVKNRVVEIFKTQQARTQALAEAEQVAKVLVESQGEYDKVIPTLQKRTGNDPVVIPQLAPLTEVRQGNFRTDYQAPPTPKEGLELPRKDLMEYLLQMVKPDKAFKLGTGAIDQLNLRLFNQAPKKDPEGKYVQVLTNQPQSAYYVAVVTKQPRHSDLDFQLTLLGAPNPILTNRPGLQNSFVQKAQVHLGKEYRNQVLVQLRESMNVYTTDQTDEKKYFEGGE